MDTPKKGSTLLDIVIGVVFWLAIIAVGYTVIASVVSTQRPPMASEYVEATERSDPNALFDANGEATWDANIERDREAREAQATSEEDRYEDMQQYNEWRQEEEDRRVLEGMIEEAIRCAEPGARNC